LKNQKRKQQKRKETTEEETTEEETTEEETTEEETTEEETTEEETTEEETTEEETTEEEAEEEFEDEEPEIILPTVDGEILEEGKEKVEEKIEDEEVTIFLNQSSVTYSGFVLPERRGALKEAGVGLSFASQGREGEDDELLIDWSLNGENWNNIVTLQQNQGYSNAQNSGYFYFELPSSLNWENFELLKIKFTALTNNPQGKELSIYLDSIWLEAIYEEEKKVEEPEIALLTFKKDFEGDEEPEFQFHYKKINEGFLASVGEALNLINYWENINTSVRVINSEGETLEILPDFVLENNGEFLLKIRKPKGFKPGLYKIILRIEEQGNVQELERDFSWGVLAINTNKSIYLPGEEAYLQMAALMDNGHTICDANLKLEIISPEGWVTSPEVQMSEECGPNNVIDKPDYFAYYQIAGTGVYEIKLTNLDNGCEITDQFETRDLVPFDVERVGPTRIYPLADYEMTLKIKANQDFSGQVIEQIPASFEIEETNYGGSTSMVQEEKSIVWDVQWKAGESYELEYTFDAPDVSPYFYLLGPLKLTEAWPRTAIFEEARQWQIAADSLSSYDFALRTPQTDCWGYQKSTNGYSFNTGTYVQTGEDAFTEGNYPVIESEDGNGLGWDNGSAKMQKFVFTIDESESNVTQLYIMANYNAETSSQVTLYVWNSDTSQWVSKATSTTTGGDVTINATISTSVGSYIDSDSKVHWYVFKEDPGGPPKYWYVDYTKMDVTYTYPDLQQIHYHWRNDDGTETGASSATSGSEDTALTALPKNTTKRVRVEISNEGTADSSSVTYRLEYGQKETTCAAISTWTDVGAGGGDWDMSLSQLVEGNDTTNIAVSIGGVSNENNNFETPNAAQKESSSQTAGITLSTTEYVEIEYSIEALAAATAGATYCFRLTNAGSTTNFTYTESKYPQVTLAGPDLQQIHYHWRNDDGTETTASSATSGSEDTFIPNPSKNTTKRLRIEISNEGTGASDAVTYRLEYGKKETTCAAISTWTDVGAGGGDWDMSDSANLTEGNNTTNIAVSTGGVTDENTTFETPNSAVKDTSSQTAGIILSTTEYVEIEYSIKALTAATSGFYCFRLTNAGSTTTFTYTKYPEAAIEVPDFYLNSSDIVFSDKNPEANEEIAISATVRNSGGSHYGQVLTDQHWDKENDSAIISGCYYVNSTIDTAQSFIPSYDFRLSKVALNFKTYGTEGTLTIKIQGDSGNLPDDSNVIATGTPTPTSGPATYTWFDFEFSTIPTLNSGTKYWIVAESTGADDNNSWCWTTDVDTVSDFPSNNAAQKGGGGWVALDSYRDCWFRTYKEPEILVKFYDGDPDGTGNQIGSAQEITNLISGVTQTAQVNWTPTSSGSYDIYVHIDRDGNISETNENNNENSKSISVLTFNQTTYRWYNNADNVQPGSVKADPNTEISGVADNEIIRARISNQVQSANLLAQTQSLKLQYAQMQGAVCGGGDETWYDMDSITSTSWYDTNWPYRKKIPISGSSGDGSDYQIKIKVGESNGASNYDFHLEGNCQPDFDDVRFADDNGTTLLDYWLEKTEGTTPNQTATFWVEVKDNLDSLQNIYIYYGHSTIGSTSNGDNTFIFFDDFPDAAINGTKWTSATVGNGSITVADSLVKLDNSGDPSEAKITTNNSFAFGNITEIKAKIKTGDNDYTYIGLKNTDNYLYQFVNFATAWEVARKRFLLKKSGTDVYRDVIIAFDTWYEIKMFSRGNFAEYWQGDTLIHKETYSSYCPSSTATAPIVLQAHGYGPAITDHIQADWVNNDSSYFMEG
jgi:hypothetical protein